MIPIHSTDANLTRRIYLNKCFLTLFTLLRVKIGKRRISEMVLTWLSLEGTGFALGFHLFVNLFYFLPDIYAVDVESAKGVIETITYSNLILVQGHSHFRDFILSFSN